MKGADSVHSCITNATTCLPLHTLHIKHYTHIYQSLQLNYTLPSSKIVLVPVQHTASYTGHCSTPNNNSKRKTNN